MTSTPTRLRAIRLYKELVRLGRDYPNPNYRFHFKLRKAFEKYRNAQGEEAEKALQLGEYIKKETIALYSLRKYRFLKNAYYSQPVDSTPASRALDDASESSSRS